MKKLTIAALTLVAITSCSKENAERVDSNDPVAVLLIQGTITRTAGNSWIEEDDKIGVSMCETENTTIWYNQENYQYKAASTASTANFTAVDDDMYYPVDGSTVDIYAYYPYTTEIESGTLSIDVSSGIETDIDLLRVKATGYSKTNAAVALAFEHRLAQLTMTITRGDGVPSSATTYPLTAEVQGSLTKADYNIISDVISSLNTVAEIPVDITLSSDDTTETATVILVPQTMPNDTNVIFTIDGEDYTWEIDDTTFTKGQDHAYDIEITREGVVVSGCEIGGWADSDSGLTGTAK